jgi:hypothetical protein
MSINRLYDTWYRQITQLLAGERITRVRNFTWLIVGIQLSRSVHLSRIAAKLPGSIRLLSWSKRLSRLVDNAALQVAPIYDPVARNWLLIAANSLGQVRLIVDGTRIGLGYHLIMISLAYRQRSLPMAWVWVKAKKGHSLASVQLALLRRVQRLVPVRVRVLLVGDSEFGAIPVLRQLDLWGWGYVLRQTAKHLLQTDAQAAWQAFGQLLSHPGQQAWLPEALLTIRHAYLTNLLAYWQPGETEPWLLATNLPSAQPALQAYRRRMWIEEMFGDLKAHGFDLEHTHLRNAERLSRLTLAVVLLYLCLMFTGTQAIKNGNRQWVDRHDRRDLSVFQIGLRWFERLWINDRPFSVCFLPPPAFKLSGG